MPQARRSTTKKARRSTTKKTAKKTSRPRALVQLEKSIDTAQGALKDLRTELGRGGRELLKDLEKTLADSRKSLRSLTKTVTQDLERLQKAATPRRAKKTARKRTGARKATTKKARSRATKK
jgi:predicted  nucleic acid-binding Zn-ribbon protein